MLIYPPSFRERFGNEMIAFANERIAAARRRRGPNAPKCARPAADLIGPLAQWLVVARASQGTDYPMRR
jgi:hypothetical protein